jgi:hypothetical protein
MTQKTPEIPHPAPTPVPTRPPVPFEANVKVLPTEPVEVLGRHKNTGQKDHKGAR